MVNAMIEWMGETSIAKKIHVPWQSFHGAKIFSNEIFTCCGCFAKQGNISKLWVSPNRKCREANISVLFQPTPIHIDGSSRRFNDILSRFKNE